MDICKIDGRGIRRNINCEDKPIDATLKCLAIVCVWTQEREIEIGMKKTQTFDCAFTKKRVTQG